VTVAAQQVAVNAERRFRAAMREHAVAEFCDGK
jgi:hypothetical protein